MTITQMKDTLSAVNVRLDKFLESGNYAQVRQRLQSSDGFTRWKNDDFQAYWDNIRISFQKGVSGIQGRDVESNPIFNTLNNLGVKGRLDLYINKSNSVSQTSSSIVPVNSISPVAGLDLERLNSINSDLNDSLSTEVVRGMNELLHHEVLKRVDGKWSLVLDSDALSSLWSNVFYPYISSSPTTVVAIGVIYLLSGILIKRAIGKFNSSLLKSIRSDSLKGMSNPPTQREIIGHRHLCESQDKVLLLMNSLDMVLVCGFAFFIGSKLKPDWPPITIPLPQSQFPSSLYPNPNPDPNPYSPSSLFPILPFNKLSKKVQSILKFILVMFFFILFIYYVGPYMSFFKNNPYLIKIFIILLSSMVIFYLFLKGLIILNYSIRSSSENNKELVTNKYLPKFIKNYLLNLKEISKYYNSNSFVKLYFVGGTSLLVILIIFIIIFL